MQLASNVVIAERFRLNRQLGRGGMGSVWHATHLGLDIPCAVKFIEGDYANLPEAQARFEREAKAAAQLRSPHVVQILDHGVWQGTPYIAMELLDGEDVGKRLSRLGRMSPHEVCTIVTQVCRALTKAHGATIVHRDLKPDNIFLVKDDDREIAKVLDFGIAKAASTGLEGGSNTKTGAMLGTPYYMSPEQAQGIKAVDHRSDLWSLAVIVFQALTGKLPFESEALGDLLVKIIVSPIPMPTQFAPDLPASIDRWWTKASQRDPAMRYQNAKEFSDGLMMVFGQSQMTDVMDRASIQKAMQQSDPGVAGGTQMIQPGGGTPRPMQHTPTPAFGTGTPQPGMGTPHPGTLALQGTPQPMMQGGMPMQQTPQPGMGSNPQMPFHQTPMPEMNTGAPVAQTFGGAEQPKKTGMIIGIAAAAVLVLVVGAVGIGMAMKGKGGGAANATTATATATTTTASATATATTAAATTTAPPSDTSASTATVAAGTSKPTVTATGGHVPAAPTGTGTGKPATTGTGKKKPVDLGI